MNRRIELNEVSDDLFAADGVVDDIEARSAPGALAGLRPWLASLADHVGDGADLSRLEVLCNQLEPLGRHAAPHETAARQTVELAGQEASTPRQCWPPLAAGLYLLKTGGFEPGRSPVSDRRTNRVVNVGSQALDVMLDAPRVRPLAVMALFYRVVKMSLARAEVTPAGVLTEVSCGVGWDRQREAPQRRSRPEQFGTTGGDGVVDWLLDELLARGLSSLTLGSVAEEHAGSRRWEVEDVFARWMADLPADQARFVAGALFCPARLAGLERSTHDRMLDVFGVARAVDEDFAPDDDAIEAYCGLLEQLDGLRKIPDGLSKTLQLTGESTSWQGRWGVAVHPMRRRRSDDRGFFVMEAGFYFQQQQGGASNWPRTTRQKLKQELKQRADRLDDRLFTAFSQCLDAVVEKLNRAPSTVLPEQTERLEPSPFWQQLPEGVEQMNKAVCSGDVQRLTDLFRRWTVPCRTPG